MKRNGFTAAAVALTAAVTLYSGVAEAQSSDKVVKGSVGLGLGVIPDYEGSNDYEYGLLLTGRVTLWNILYADLIDIRTGRPDLTLGAHLLRRPNFRAGPMVRVLDKRDEDDNNQLEGLGDVDYAIEVGFYAEAKANNLLFRVEGGQDVNEAHEGFILDMKAEYQFRPLDRVRASFGVSTAWASDSYMEQYFGVSAAQAASATDAGITAFSAGSGFKELGVNISATYDITRNWGVNALLSYRRLLQDAEESPLTDAIGDANQYYLGTTVVYRF